MNKKRRWIVVKMAVMITLMPLCTQAASFDCAKATTKIEKMICADVELSKLDEEMGKVYSVALARTEQADAIKQEQKAWLKERNKCTDIDCIKRAYETRLGNFANTGITPPETKGDKSEKITPSVKPCAEAFPNRSDKLGPFTFKLTKGKGIAVCEAYLQRLNHTEFENYPFCGRPEDDSVPGFTRLNRVTLTAEEVYALYPKVSGFWSSQDQYKYNKDILPLDSVRFRISLRRLGAWRYDPPVDIDNDGKPDNLFIFYGVGGGFSCGSIDGHMTFPGRISYYPNILDEQNLYIDEARTRELFQHPIGWYEISFDRFRYLANTIGIFLYQGEYYLDTFYDSWGDFHGKRREQENIEFTLAVFSRKDGVTRDICEYDWTNWQNSYVGGK